MSKNKYLVLIFSDRKGKPSENFKKKGVCGLRHFEKGYLKTLPIIGEFLKRKVVLPPPWISLSHNNKKTLKSNTWENYFNLDKIKNLDRNPPFEFKNNCDIKTDLSVGYYLSNTPINELTNKNEDIIALVNCNDDDSNLKIYSHVYLKSLKNYKSVKYSTNSELLNYGKKIINELKLKNFIFIHSRRGDMLDNKVLLEKGTRQFTNPKYIFDFVNHINNLGLNKIFIATNEKDINYKKDLKELFKNYIIYFEEDFFKFLPEYIINDNTMIYLISHEIALKSKISISSTHWIRLGKTESDYKLSDRSIYKKLRNRR